MLNALTGFRGLEAVRRTGVGALHVSVNTQESLDQNLARSCDAAVVGVSIASERLRPSPIVTRE